MNSLQLASPADAGPAAPQKTYTVSQEYLEYFNRLRVNQIEPALDLAWQQNLKNIFEQMPLAWQKTVAQEVLVIKRIDWDEKTGDFHFRPDPMSLDEFSRIHCHPKLRPLAAWCADGVQRLRKMDDSLEIADWLENVLGKIRNVNLEDDAQLLASRRALHEKFIYAAGAAIREKTDLKIPENLRNLSVGAVKSFINEVFLKHQLLDYWFQVLRQRQLARLSHPLLNQWLSQEQKTRRLEVVQTSQYLFAVANTHESDVNLFSIRRFLNEEKIHRETYLNAAFIKNDQFDDAHNVRAFKNQVSCIITIEGRINKAILDIFEKMEDYYDEFIRPALFSRLEAYNVSLETAIGRKLRVLEEELQAEVLKPFKKGLTQHAITKDDFSYLFINIQQIFSEIIIDFREFQLRPAVLRDVPTERFMMRLLAYVKLLNKRHSALFNTRALENWEENRAAVARPLAALKDMLESASKNQAGKIFQAGKLEDALNQPENWLDKILPIRKWKRKKLEALQLEIQAMTRQVYLNVMNEIGKNKKNMIYMEHESMLFSSRRRSYALCAGNNGVDEFPALLVLPEGLRGFDPQDCLDILFPKKTVWNANGTAQE